MESYWFNYNIFYALNYFFCCRKIFKIDLLEEKKTANKFPEPILIETVEENINAITCQICFEYIINTVSQCGHPVCSNCLSKLENCPICRQKIIKSIPLYFPL